MPKIKLRGADSKAKPVRLELDSSSRVLIAGKTGSGKTYLAEKLLAGVPRLVVIDSKATLGHWRFDNPDGETVDWQDWFAFGRGENRRLRVVPPIMDAEEVDEWYEKLFERLYNAADLTLYIDEAYAVTNPNRPGKWLTALYTRGRELGIGVWASTQRPTRIPLFLITESETIISFRLNWPDDRKRLAGVAGPGLMRSIPAKDKHGFYLYRLEEERPRYFEGVE